ncbi:hypothetical protein [Calothrix rhizosoleniae]|uniref:hypothetical protein n=1 Tax=Calothrix rhizosoleniae TaxID=888997 RepID=UPI001F298102|nr:hypothetical protein [Calothrix rhizosoleniae]
MDVEEKHMGRSLIIWSITLPLCGVLMFAIGCVTTIYMVNGRYRIDVVLNTKELRVKTDVDKRECQVIENIAKDSPDEKM